MNDQNLRVLAVALLMFAQLAQTLYSPALGDIGQAFAVEPERAGQTLSVYFLGFACGPCPRRALHRCHRRRWAGPLA